MDQEKKTPQLLGFYFGEHAASAHSGASRRLKKWARAFDEWIDERTRLYQKHAVRHSLNVWRMLVRHCGKMPWELKREDIEAYIAWMEGEGYARGTIARSVELVSSFYRWCARLRVDTACGEGFNPAGMISLPGQARFEGQAVWSCEEVEAFLKLLSLDQTRVGMRDRALFGLRLASGVSNQKILGLTWEQLEFDGQDVRVHWRPGNPPLPLPRETWHAIREYLQASGRLEGMQPGKFIFPPLVAPWSQVAGKKMEDWRERKALSKGAISHRLKLYGRPLGLKEEKLSMLALRRTAIRMKMDQGESLKGLHAFMDSRTGLKLTGSRLGHMPALPAQSELIDGSMQPPDSKGKPFTGVEGITHGFFRRSQDTAAVQQIRMEGAHGMDQEVARLRELMRGMLSRDMERRGAMEMYLLSAQRLSMLISATEKPEKPEEAAWVEQTLAKIDEMAAMLGTHGMGEAVRNEVFGTSSDGEGQAGKVAEVVATVRLMLRNIYRRAEAGVGDEEYLRLVNLYGVGCDRLKRLLAVEGNDAERLRRYVQESFAEAIRQLWEDKPWEKPEWNQQVVGCSPDTLSSCVDGE
jgi:integrase